MNKQKRTGTVKKIALIVSLCAILLWTALGTGTSLAWFTDVSSELINIFHFADFELKVSYLEEDGSWADLEGTTSLFSENALYEPGYVQVVYLKAENLGEIPFLLQGAVSVVDYTVATNVFGQEFYLQDHLRFGFLMTDGSNAPFSDLASLQGELPHREAAETVATEPLSRYDSEIVEVAAGEAVYMALVVRMPKEVNNIANYDEEKTNDLPKVDLGVVIKASQVGAP